MRSLISKILLISIFSATGFEMKAGAADTLSLQLCMEKAELYSFRIEEFEQKTSAAQSALEQQKTVALPGQMRAKFRVIFL